MRRHRSTILLLGLAACGGDDGGSVGTDGTDGSSGSSGSSGTTMATGSTGDGGTTAGTGSTGTGGASTGMGSGATSDGSTSTSTVGTGTGGSTGDGSSGTGTTGSTGGSGTGGSGSSSGGGTTGGVVLPACLPPAYVTHLAGLPTVVEATIDRLDATGQQQLCDDLEALEVNASLTVDEPAASVTCVEPTYCLYITLTVAEIKRIQAAKYAHALWIDLHGSVPWSLGDYSVAELDGLFDPQVLFRNGNQFMSVVDHSPSEAWAYVVDQGLVGATPDATLIAVLEDLRSTDAAIDFIHGIGGTHPTTTAYTLDGALNEWVDQGGEMVRVSRYGCHSMSRIVLALLRAMNVPGREQHDGQWFSNQHSSAGLPLQDAAVPHGDHLYSAVLRAAPAAELVASSSFYVDPVHTAVCGNDTTCLGFRHSALAAVAYPATYTKVRCCDPGTYNYASCSDYLTQNYGSYLTAGEIAAAETSITSGC